MQKTDYADMSKSPGRVMIRETRPGEVTIATETLFSRKGYHKISVRKTQAVF